MSVCDQQQAGLRSDHNESGQAKDSKPKAITSAPQILGNQGGQAVLEYILVLVVVVGIILGGLYQVNTAFRAWAQNYFGDYLSCLLETGELPALGGSLSGAAGICNELYEPYSIDKGRPLLAQSGGSGGSGSSSSSSSRSSEPSNSSGSERGTRDGGSGSGGSSRMSSGSRFGSTGRFQSSRDTAQGGKASSGSSYTGSTDGSIPMSLLNSAGNGRFRITNPEMSMDYGMDFERERKAIKTTESAKKSEDSVQERGRKKAAPFRAPASQAQEKPDEEMTFGSFLRYLVIAAIIIALVLVVGGQLLQISKSSGSD